MDSVEIIIPAFNEEQCLRRNMETLVAHIRTESSFVAWRICIAVNGSNDRTAEIAMELEEMYPVFIRAMVISQAGKGNAIKSAALVSTADYILFMDADLAVSLENMRDVLAPVLSRESDMAIASRLLRQSKTERSYLRTLSSRSYNLLSRMVLGHALSDLQCGCKVGSRELFQSVLPDVRDTQWFFDTELVMLALRGAHA
jgi:glycosyltransferase involved in cell wall biosynthesis